MQRNCGVLAYDKLVGELNGRSNVISMDTLAKLATDNGFLLYPTKVPIEHMTDVPLPCIVYTSHHFTFLEDLARLDSICMSRAFVYVLTHELVNPDWVMDSREAKGIRGADIGQMFTPPKNKSPWEAMTSGSTGGWAAFAGPSKPTNPQDPKGWGWVGPALTTAAGAIPVVGPFISAGMGAAGSMGGGSGFQGTDKGWSNVGSTLLGAAGGYGAGVLGQGIGSGLYSAAGGMPTGAASTYAADQTGANAGTWGQGLLGNFGSGFGQGLQNAAPWAAGLVQKTGGAINNVYGGLTGLMSGGQAAGSATSGTGGLAGAMKGLLGTGATQAGETAGGLGGFGELLDLATGLKSMFGEKSQETANLFDEGFMNLPEVLAFKDQIGQAKTALGKMSQEELAKVIQAQPGSIIPDSNAYFEAATRRVQEAGAMKREQVTRSYNSIGRANSSEHMQALALVDKETAQALQDTAAVLANQKLQLEITYKTAALAQALQIDQQTAADIAGLTNLSVTEAAMKYGIQEAEVQQVRAVSGMQNILDQLRGINQPSGNVQNLLNSISKVGQLAGMF